MPYALKTSSILMSFFLFDFAHWPKSKSHSECNFDWQWEIALYPPSHPQNLLLPPLRAGHACTGNGWRLPHTECSKSHKLTRQNCRRMPHEILMKNTSAKAKKKRKEKKRGHSLSICNKCDKLLKCTGQEGREGGRQAKQLTKTKPKPMTQPRPESKSVVNCKRYSILYL